MLLHDPVNQFALIALLFFLYFLPALVACGRHHKNAASIFLTTLFFGWTLLGWLIALIWSASANVEAQVKPVQ